MTKPTPPAKSASWAGDRPAGRRRNLDPTWFAEPLTNDDLLDDPARRQALLSLLDSFLPADATGPALASGPSEQVQAHPLLPDGGIGNLYFTVEPDADGTVVLGLAGKVAGRPPRRWSR